MTTEDHQKLLAAEAEVARKTEELRRAEGQRDSLLARLIDNEGTKKR